MSNNNSLTVIKGKQDLQVSDSQQQTLNLSEILQYAEMFSKSGFFDAKIQAQCAVKILAGQELGIAPFTAMKEIKIYNGQLSLSSNVIAALIKKSKHYDYKIVKLDAKECILNFYTDGKLDGESKYTIEDAERAELIKKEVWKKYPEQLLFARALTKGQKFHCPQLTMASVYTPEEMEDLPKEDSIDVKAETSLTLEQETYKQGLLLSIDKMLRRLQELEMDEESLRNLPYCNPSDSIEHLKNSVEPFAKALKTLLIQRYLETLSNFNNLIEHHSNVANKPDLLELPDFASKKINEIDTMYNQLNQDYNTFKDNLEQNN